MLTLSGRLKSTIKGFLIAILFFILCSGSLFAYDITMRVSILGNQPAIKVSCSRELTLKNAVTMKTVMSGEKEYEIKTYQGKIFVNKTETGADYLYILTDALQTPIYLNGTPYRGYYLAALNDSGNLMVINHVALEDYLQGVLAGEISEYWPIESIKAQAVAARTYALYKKMQAPKGRLWDVANDTTDQMYIGVQGESPVFTKAISQTRSQVLAINGKIVCAYYHSSCGGHTCDSKEVFKSYSENLRGTRDPYCAGAPNSNWSCKVSSDVIKFRLNKDGFKVGKIFSIKPQLKDKSGRTREIRIDHEGGITFLTGAEFRGAVGFKEIKSSKFSIIPCKYSAYTFSPDGYTNYNPAGSISELTKKTLFHQSIESYSTTNYPKAGEYNPAGNYPKAAPQAKKGSDAKKTLKIPQAYEFAGSGWGHGVGLCQWGCRGAAKSGASYRQILKHYYPDAVLCAVKRK